MRLLGKKDHEIQPERDFFTQKCPIIESFWQDKRLQTG